MKNRIFVSLLCIAILYTTVCSTVCASDFSEAGLIEEGASVLVQDAEGNELLINKEVYDEAVTISEDVAKEAALLFVSDIIACEDGVEWNENTAVTSIVPMYDEDKSEITAYTFYLTEGYVVVSAFLDTPYTVMEWSDKAEPVIECFDAASTEEYIYLGAMEYYADIGDATLQDVDGTMVERTELDNSIEADRDAENLPSAVVEDMATLDDNKEVSTMKVTPPRDVRDPFKDANVYYRGPFVCQEWCNKWDDDMYYLTRESIGTEKTGVCVPLVITCAIRAYAFKHDDFLVREEKIRTFNKVYNVGDSEGWITVRGVQPEVYGKWAKKAFDKYGIETKVGENTDLKYETMKGPLKRGSLLLVGMDKYDEINGTVFNHAVLGFAYTRLKSQSTGYMKTYLKAADTLSTSARYYDLKTIIKDEKDPNSRDAKFYEIYFYK